MDPDEPPPAAPPSILQWTLGFLLVGMAWGLTTPFMRKAALNYKTPPHAALSRPLGRPAHFLLKTTFAIYDLVFHNYAYMIPFLLNVTGSVWFFLLIGRAELSLTVPVTNSLAFLFTVLGEWWVDGRAVDRRTAVGLVCVVGGVAGCVWGKS